MTASCPGPFAQAAIFSYKRRCSSLTFSSRDRKKYETYGKTRYIIHNCMEQRSHIKYMYIFPWATCSVLLFCWSSLVSIVTRAPNLAAIKHVNIIRKYCNQLFRKCRPHIWCYVVCKFFQICFQIFMLFVLVDWERKEEESRGECCANWDWNPGDQNTRRRWQYLHDDK